MRIPLARMVGLAAAASLIATSLAVASPANAIDPGNGVISVTIVDDLGQPVKGMVQLTPLGDGETVTLGLPDEDSPPVAASSYLEEVPAGIYGAMVIGGWAGVTCVGLASCSVMSLEGSGPSLGAGAFTINAGATTPLTITVATPKLTGNPGVGQPLTVTVPASLKELGNLVAGIGGGFGLPADASIAWNRNGAANGATGTTYTPTAGDAGSTISATVTYPGLISLLLGQMAPGIAPAPFTTAAVSIKRLTPSLKLSVPGKIKLGKRPTAYVNVRSGQTPVGGVVRFTVDKLRPQQAVLRSGLATFKLPKLKAGKHKVTASFAAAGAYNAAKTTKTIVVGKKAKKGKK